MSSKRKNIVILSGAGISAESGLGTFRDNGGLWDKYDIHEVATPEAWHKNPQLVLEFYNERRKNVRDSLPNKAHYSLVALEEYHNVQIITQNIDDLHERAGSSNVLHLHGEILKGQCSVNFNDVFELTGNDILWGDQSPSGFQSRPNVVWFGEPVPKMVDAERIAHEADIFIVIGTSLNVYPAANLIFLCKQDVDKHLVDIKPFSNVKFKNLRQWSGKATEKVPELVEFIIQDSKV